MEQNFLTFRLCASIEFDREIKKGEYYISVGGFAMIMNGKEVSFDFEEFQGYINDNCPNTLDIICKNPDYDTFEDLKIITEEMLSDVQEITEFSIYTGEDGEPEIYPVKVKELCFVLPYKDFERIDVSQQVLDSIKF